MEKILIRLPADRTQLGNLCIVDDNSTILFGPIACLGKSDNEAALQHNNVKRLSIYPYGDTPLGDYVPARISAHAPPGDMGNRVIWLQGLDGDALVAASNGRLGLAIHAGRGDTGGPYSGLFPTDGCVRISDTSMDALALFMGDNVLPISVVQA